MNNFFCFLFICVLSFCFGQSYTLQQAENTSDIRVIAGFIKDNPTHPKVPFLKRKMASLMGRNPSNNVTTSTTNAPIPTKTMANNTGYGKSYNKDNGYVDKHRTAELLTHIFNNDPNKKEIYLSIFNESKCDLEVLIKGKSTHKLKVPSMKSNFVLIDKGSYTLSSTVCGAAYHATKSLYKDLEIKLKN